MSNVLLNLADEPRYDEITTADIKPAMQAAIAEARDAIAEVKAQADITWGNTVEQLTDITERAHLGRGGAFEFGGRHAAVARGV